MAGNWSELRGTDERGAREPLAGAELPAATGEDFEAIANHPAITGPQMRCGGGDLEFAVRAERDSKGAEVRRCAVYTTEEKIQNRRSGKPNQVQIESIDPPSMRLSTENERR